MVAPVYKNVEDTTNFTGSMKSDILYFSIIVPMYNRERFVSRALRSVLAQDFEDFEIIVVDDGSTDNSIAVVKAMTDPRISLICHETNRGVGPARNTGVDAASGQWVVWLDSDDELLPGALSKILLRVCEISHEVSRLQFMCQFDNGEMSPNPPLINEIWDYEGYVRWMEKVYSQRSETLSVSRRSTFLSTRYCDDRSLESLYHLRFAKRFLIRSCPDVVRLYHFDAENQLTKSDFKQEKKAAESQLVSHKLCLLEHGEALIVWAPRVYISHLLAITALQFLLGKRREGMVFAIQYLQQKPFSPRAWIIIASGILGPKYLAWSKRLLNLYRRINRQHGRRILRI